MTLHKRCMNERSTAILDSNEVKQWKDEQQFDRKSLNKLSNSLKKKLCFQYLVYSVVDWIQSFSNEHKVAKSIHSAVLAI